MSTHRDVRMQGFTRRTRVADAWEWLDRQASPNGAEQVGLDEAAGRVIAAEMVSAVDVPSFARGMMDGYAVRAADTTGASEYNRLTLRVVGEVLPGQQATTAVGAGEAIRIMTGAALPAGANAVIPVEKTEAAGDKVAVTDAVPPGKHVGRVGEDIAVGATVLRVGRQLRPQDLGVLSSIGVSSLSVRRQPRVRIVITGNELLPPGTPPSGERISDANSPMLRALISRDGGIVIHPGIVPDSPAAIREALREDADIVIVAGGSSVGREDYAPAILAEEGELAIHGISMRPSSPTGMGRLGSKLVFLLPGNPVSCLCAYDFFAGRAIRAWGGREKEWPYRRVQGRLKRKLVSVVGRVDYARVETVDGLVEPIAIGGAALLSTTTRATGFVIIPEDSEGYAAGAKVDMFLY